jgi:uncharacterized protein YqgC (DUF456 family)
MSADPTPPLWGEAILRVVLKRTDVDSVSGDLLEEYREAVYPARGREGADRWYVAQVVGFAMRSFAVWGVLFGTAAVARDAFDQFVPTHDFALRSAVSTYLGISILLVAGFWSAWRSGSFAAGTLAGVVATIVGAVISISSATVMLALFHDPQTLAAIDASGGLSEAFTLPITMLIPGLILGTLGGVLGAAASATLRVDLV